MMKMDLLKMLLVAVQLICLRCQEYPSFRIISPQNICKADDNSTIQVPNGVTISFQPRDGIKLNYKFRIFFKIMDPDFTQREILLIWKAIRTLEYRLNIKDRLEIQKNNDLFINKNDLVPGITYIFHVVGVTDNGQKSNEQNFSLQYANGVLQNSNIPQGINLLLIGTEVSVVNVDYVLYAKVTFCKEPKDYYMLWKIFGLDEEYQHLNDVISAWLTIPADTFKASSEVEIEAYVKEFNTTKVLAKDTLMLNVAQRGFQTHIFPAAAQIGVNRPLSFELSFTDFDNDLDELEVEWYYYEQSGDTQRDLRMYKANMKYNVSFGEAGHYQVNAKVSLGESFTKVVADVMVIPIIMTEFEFLSSPKSIIASNESFQYTVIVSNLIPECRAGWTSAQEDGFLYINEDEVDKTAFGQLEVSDLEKRYLMEIMDFDNATFTREIMLNIPAPDRMNSNWAGLQGDSKYKFRLNVQCPLKYNGANDVIISFIELILNINAPPFMDGLSIEPNNGTALKTIFQITATDAKDVLLDAPLSYELCGIFDDFELCLGKYLEYKSWDTILPLTLKPLKLFVRSCDLRQACGVVYGKDVLMNYDSSTLTEYDYLKHAIISYLLRTDFKEALNQMFMISLTLQNTNSALLADFKGFVKATLQKEVNKMLEHTSSTEMNLPTADVLSFVRQTKMNLDLLSLADAAMLEQLFDIVHQTDIEEKIIDLEPSSEVFELERRQRRQTYMKLKQKHKAQSYDTTVEKHKLSLQLLNDLLQLEPTSASKYLQRLNEVATNICQVEQLHKQVLTSELVTLTIEKLNGKHLKRRFLKLFHIDNPVAQVKLIEKNVPINSDKKYCLTTAYFSKDLLTNKPDFMLQIQIKDVLTNMAMLEWQAKEASIEITPNKIQLGLQKTIATIHKCQLRTEEKWSEEYCTTIYENATYILCECSYLGYYRLARTAELPTVASNSRPIPTRSSLNNALTRFPTQGVLLNQLSTTAGPAFTMSALPTRTSPALQTTTSKITSTSVVTRKPVMATTTTRRSVNNTTVANIVVAKAKVKRASISSYMIPIAAILIITTLSALFLVYYRRYMGKNKETAVPVSAPNLEIRLPRSGVHYAALHDTHLLSGNFNTT